MAQFVALPPDLAPGTHGVTLERVEPTDSADYGRGLAFVFSNADGQFTKRTGETLKPGRSFWTLMEGLLGRAIKGRETVDPDTLCGKQYTLHLHSEKRPRNGSGETDTIVVFGSVAPAQE